jgi:undecaprenyl-diphosphatase
VPETRTQVLVTLLGAGISLSLAALLGLLATSDQTLVFDRSSMLWVHQWTSPYLTLVLQTVTWLGAFAVAGPLSLVEALVFFRMRRPGPAVIVLLAVSSETIVNNLAKLTFARPRPELWPYLADASGFSYPSGHATLATVAYGLSAVLLLRCSASIARPPIARSVGDQVGEHRHAPLQPANQAQIPYPAGVQRLVTVVATTIIALVAGSRVYLGVHYPTDVVGGVLLGAGWSGLWLAVVKVWLSSNLGDYKTWPFARVDDRGRGQ